KGMAGGRQLLGIVEGADMEMDLAGPALALVAQGRAAAPAEAAPHAGRGIEVSRRLAGELYFRRVEAGIGRDRRASVPPTAVTVARPLGRTVRGEADLAAQAAAASHLSRRGAGRCSGRADGSRRHARPARGHGRSSPRCGPAGTAPAPNPWAGPARARASPW